MIVLKFALVAFVTAICSGMAATVLVLCGALVRQMIRDAME